MITRSIEVTTRFIGFHKWEDAPEEVSFLRNLHRHEFRVSVEIEITHDDRELEFFIEQRYLKSLFEDEQNCNNKSCEMIGQTVIDSFIERYGPNRSIKVNVSEDGENSANVVYIPQERVSK